MEVTASHRQVVCARDRRQVDDVDRACSQEAVDLESVYTSDPVKIHVNGKDLTDPVCRLAANFCRRDIGLSEGCLQEGSEQ